MLIKLETNISSWATAEQLKTIFQLAEQPRLELLTINAHGVAPNGHLTFEALRGKKSKRPNRSAGRINLHGEVIHDNG